MPGSWLAGRPLSPKSEFTRDRKSELDFNALIRGPAAIGAAHKGRTYDCTRPNCTNAHKNSCQLGASTYDKAPASGRRQDHSAMGETQYHAFCAERLKDGVGLYFRRNLPGRRKRRRACRKAPRSRSQHYPHHVNKQLYTPPETRGFHTWGERIA
jgi:hypothetical protein